MEKSNLNSEKADVYVPIDFSDTKSVIPPGEDIIYSTLCKASGAWTIGNKTKTAKWLSHVLITPSGVAFSKPVNPSDKKLTLENTYLPWHEIDSIASLGRFGLGFAVYPMSFKIKREENFETEETFNKRKDEFIPKFRPLLIQRKDEWLEVNENNPEIKKREKKWVKKYLAKMKAAERKRFINIAKDVAKKSKKLGKKKKKKENSNFKKEYNNLRNEAKDLIRNIKKKIIDRKQSDEETYLLEKKLENLRNQLNG